MQTVLANLQELNEMSGLIIAKTVSEIPRAIFLAEIVIYHQMQTLLYCVAAENFSKPVPPERKM